MQHLGKMRNKSHVRSFTKKHLRIIIREKMAKRRSPVFSTNGTSDRGTEKLRGGGRGRFRAREEVRGPLEPAEAAGCAARGGAGPAL